MNSSCQPIKAIVFLNFSAPKNKNYRINNALLLICYYNSEEFNNDTIIQESKKKGINIVMFAVFNFINKIQINLTAMYKYNLKLSEALMSLQEGLAEHVHSAWAEGRIKYGWKSGPECNDTLKTHPCLVPYNELSEIENKYDCVTSQETIRFILGRGFKITKYTRN